MHQIRLKNRQMLRMHRAVEAAFALPFDFQLYTLKMCETNKFKCVTKNDKGSCRALEHDYTCINECNDYDKVCLNNSHLCSIIPQRCKKKPPKRKSNKVLFIIVGTLFGIFLLLVGLAKYKSMQKIWAPSLMAKENSNLIDAEHCVECKKLFNEAMAWWCISSKCEGKAWCQDHYHEHDKLDHGHRMYPFYMDALPSEVSKCAGECGKVYPDNADEVFICLHSSCRQKFFCPECEKKHSNFFHKTAIIRDGTEDSEE